MLEDVRRFLEAGRLDRAREKLGEALGDFFRESFAAGRADYPLLTRRGLPRLREIRELAPRLLEERGEYVAEALGQVEAGCGTEAPDDGVVLLLNHALCLLIPDYPVRLAAAIQDAKFELGAKASNVESPLPDLLPRPDLRSLVTLVEEATHALHEQKFSGIENLGLDFFDAPEDSLPDLPPISSIEDDQLAFTCLSCGGSRREALTLAGDFVDCPCGATLRVPLPGLARLAAYLKAKEEAARGIGRCRVCGAVVRTSRDGFMKAGFCSALCARTGGERFGEFVPREGKPEGDQILFSCRCGAALRAPVASGGTPVPCGACSLKVWVPPPAAAAPAKGAILTCAKCGRNVKSTAKRCMYCGTSIS